MKYIVGICLIISVLSCTETAETIPDELSKDLSFTEWLEGSPQLSIKSDTLYSDLKPTPKDCQRTLPGVECFYGHYFSMYNQSETNTQYYMVNSYVIDSSEVLYIEVFNYEGRRVFSRSVFDYEFIKQNDHFSKFYQNDRWFVIENLVRKNGEEEIISTQKIEILSMSEI